MAAPIEIPIASETKAFAQGVENGIIDPLEDAEQALRDLGKAGDRAGGDLDDALSDAQRETKASKRELERLAEQMEQTGRKGRTIGDGVKAGTSEATDAVQEFGDEARQNMSETFSSFRGEAEDFAQIAQDTLGGLASSLGPAGMAAGIAGAAGIGLIIQAFNDGKISEEEFRERVAGLVDTLIETGGEGADAIQAIADRMRELVSPTDAGSMSLEKIRRQAADAGVEFDELAQAYAHAGGDLEAYIREVDAAAASTYDQSDSVLQVNQATVAQKWALEGVSDELRTLADEQAAAAQAERDWVESGGAAIEARARQMETLQGELDEAMGSWDEYKDAETGALDPAGYIAAMQARRDATANFNTNVQQLAVEFGLSHDEVQAILDQGVDFAPMLQSILDSGMGAEYASQVRSMLDGGQAIVDGSPINQTVTAVAETETAGERFAALVAPQTARVTAEADTKRAALQLDDFTSRQRTATVTAVANTTGANAAINAIAEERLVTIRTRVLDPRGVPVP